MSKHGRVLVAMSGGIDSTATAMMLHEQGYEVVGITMKTWDYATSGGSKKETGCCSLDSINDARAVAVRLGFHHFVVDIREEFGSFVIDNFVEEYMAGRTPNPCVLCNTHIKWNSLLRRADALDCGFIATGHYAQIHTHEDRKFIRRATDRNKDQSYVLWGLTQDCLDRTMFPLGEMVKPDVRKYVFDNGLDDLSQKPESFEICFVPDNDYRGFLRRQVPDLDEKFAGGPFVDKHGKVVGKHRGYPFYTIGQRKNLGIALGRPVFVTQIIPETNTIVLGDVDDLVKNGMQVYKLNMQKYFMLPEALEAETKIRHQDLGTMSSLHNLADGRIGVDFHAVVRGVAPGQSAVFYEGDDVIGGGIIHSSYRHQAESTETELAHA
jgi:tRNA-uridine 2-sulfurtransferase